MVRIARSWLAPGIVSAAVIGTAALSVAAAGPLAAAKATVLSRKSVLTAGPVTPAAKAGWQVAAKVGPAGVLAADGIGGAISARGPKAAWAVWTGKAFDAVDRWTGTRWEQVTVPAKLAGYVRSVVAFDGQAGYLWLLDAYRPTAALVYSGGKWTTARLPSWVVRKQTAGGYDVKTAVFGKDDVWVFSLNSGGYAAHYNGEAWTKVKLPATPTAVSADASNDIWALSGRSVMHRTPSRGWRTVAYPPLPPSGLPVGSLVYSDLVAAAPDDVSLVVSVTAKAGAGDDTWFVQQWNGKSWGYLAGNTDFVGSVAPDGRGGVWADGVNANPGGFWTLAEWAGDGKWTGAKVPSGVWTQSPLTLTAVPGTRSLWATGEELPTPTGGKGLILRYNP